MQLSIHAGKRMGIGIIARNHERIVQVALYATQDYIIWPGHGGSASCKKDGGVMSPTGMEEGYYWGGCNDGYYYCAALFFKNWLKPKTFSWLINVKNYIIDLISSL